MPVLRAQNAGTSWEFTGTYYKDGVESALTGATLKAMLKLAADDADAAAVATVTTTPDASGSITIGVGAGGVADAGYTIKFLPPATTALMATPPTADLYFGLRIKEADADEYEIIPARADDPVRIPVRVPVVRAIP